jgi:hypothetical protein
VKEELKILDIMEASTFAWLCFNDEENEIQKHRYYPYGKKCPNTKEIIKKIMVFYFIFCHRHDHLNYFPNHYPLYLHLHFRTEKSPWKVPHLLHYWINPSLHKFITGSTRSKLS